MFNDHNAYLIAEVGANHQGDVETAKRYIKEFASSGANAIKFQVRTVDYLFHEDALARPYDNPNSFGETYGAHREFLELSMDALKELKKECSNAGVHFMATAFDELALERILDVDVDVIKIASFDAGNIPFLERVAGANKPVICSTGGANIDAIKSSVSALASLKQDLGILHCVSEYPCPHDRLGLNAISTLKNYFVDHTIGLSDHFSGISSGPVAWMLGARIFEKHVTFNRSWKGTDHSFALTVDGFRKFARDIRRTPEMLNEKPSELLGAEPVFKKLGKALVLSRSLKAGEEITTEALTGRIFSTSEGIPVRESHNVIGKVAKADLDKGHRLVWDDFAQS